MITETFNCAKAAKFLKIAPCTIIEINGRKIERTTYVNITNAHITAEHSNGIIVFQPPFVISFTKP